jgi:hypothetical protein
MSMSTKRMFRREGAALVDFYQDEVGGRCHIHIPAEWLQESVAINDSAQKEALREIATGAPGVPMGLYAFGGEAPAELLETLLDGIAAGSWRAPLMLLRFLDDPRVRPALSSAARHTPVEDLGNIVQALGLAGGHDACDVLRERMNEMLTDPQTFLPHAFSNYRASTLAITAAALLRLEPQALDAARVLVRLFEHPCALDRYSAVREATDVYRHELSTDAMRELRAGLRGLLESADDALLVAAAPTLAVRSFDIVHRRCMKVLNGPDHLLQTPAAMALARMPPPHTATALASLVRWVPHGVPLRLALTVASLVTPFVPETVAQDLARRGRTPMGTATTRPAG